MKTTTGHKNQRYQQTIDKITDSYLTLMQKKPWNKITVKELCSYAGITRGTFYLYFSDLYELMSRIQDSLLEDFSHRYRQLSPKPSQDFSYESFPEKFNYAAPESLNMWFAFCRENRSAIMALLHPEYGDEYFSIKIKNRLRESIIQMMDCDHMSQDPLRTYFLNLFTEMHLIVIRSWLFSRKEDTLSVNDMIQLLNSLRVGANYLVYKHKTCPDFAQKIHAFDDSNPTYLE